MAGIEDMGGRRRVVYGPINFCSALPSCFELSLLKKNKNNKKLSSPDIFMEHS